MLDITNCKEHYDHVFSCAAAHPNKEVLECLQYRLEYLGGYACTKEEPDKTRCKLYKDHAPGSCGFVIERKQEDGSYKFWMNGGLIYWPNDKVPNWTVHT